MTDGLGFVELVIVGVILLVPLLTAVLLVRVLLRAVERRGSASGELASLRERVARFEADRGTEPAPRDAAPRA
ncbi:MAG: hypothetical protein ACYC3Q_10065 [Gemmatimonadaceae bacterium]